MEENFCLKFPGGSMTATFYIHTPSIAEQHRANMAATLAHRIEVAQRNNDVHLLEQLKREQRELENATPYRTASGLLQKLGHLWQDVMKAMAQADLLKVEEVVDRDGEVWWYAHDPKTGKALWAQSEAEVIKWIEDNHLGH
jgi:NAD-dependent oxidoreductase involved in siderophore biosynthesis